MSERVIRQIMDKVGLPEEEARRAYKVLDDFRLEHGEEVFRAMLIEMSRLIKIANQDGVSVTTLLQAMIRKPS